MMHTNSQLTGVYAIHCKVNDFIYIGSAAGRRGFRGRLWTHTHHLRMGIHHSPILQRHYNRYGEEAFEFYILETCTPKDCLRYEQSWLDIRGIGYQNRSYNVSPVTGSQLGCKRSPEACKKMAKVHIGNKYRVGSKMSDETKAKLREINLGKTYPPEVRAKIALAGTGRKQSPETIAKRVQHRKLHPLSPEAIASISRRAAEANSLEFVVTTPDGVELAIKNVAAFCREHGLTKTQMINAAKGRCIGHKGYKCRYAHETKEEQEAKIRAIQAARNIRDYIVTSPNGEEFRTDNLAAFCNAHGLDRSPISAIARGERRIYKGWQCRLAVETEELQLKRLSLQGKLKTYIVTLPSGAEVLVDNLPQFCLEHGLDTSGMTKVAKGKRPQYKGYRIRYTHHS